MNDLNHTRHVHCLLLCFTELFEINYLYLLLVCTCIVTSTALCTKLVLLLWSYLKLNILMAILVLFVICTVKLQFGGHNTTYIKIFSNAPFKTHYGLCNYFEHAGQKILKLCEIIKVITVTVKHQCQLDYFLWEEYVEKVVSNLIWHKVVHVHAYTSVPIKILHYFNGTHLICVYY